MPAAAAASAADGFGHSRNSVDLQHKRLAAVGQNDVNTPVNLQAERAKGSQRYFLNFGCFFSLILAGQTCSARRPPED